MDDPEGAEQEELVRRILEVKQRYIESINDFAAEVIDYVRNGRAPAGTPPPQGPTASTRTKKMMMKKKRKKTGRQDKTSMIVKRIAIINGPKLTEAWIDDHPTSVKLGHGATLWNVLWTSASKRGNNDLEDGLVPAKRKDKLVEMLTPKLGYKIGDPDTLRAHVMRLREAIAEAGLPPGLVETVGNGYRFRLARDGQITVNGQIVA
jgi:hypothetical protein